MFVRATQVTLDTTPDAEHRVPPMRIVNARAAEQAGCVTRGELLAARLTPGEIDGLLKREVLVSVLPGVYGLGLTVLSQEALWWAALMAGGNGSRLAGRSALEAHGVLPRDDKRAAVTVPRRGMGGPRTLETALPTSTGKPASITIASSVRAAVPQQLDRGLWVDPVIRAIDDLAATGQERELRKAWREADYLGKLDDAAVTAHLRTAPPGAGMVRTLRAEIPLVGDDTVLLSRAERWLLEHLVKAGVARPSVNQLVEFSGWTVRPDFWWLLAQLVVEVDGPGHKKPSRKAEDERRDAHLRGLGVEVMRFDDADVWSHVEACVAAITARIAERTVDPAVRSRVLTVPAPSAAKE